MPLCLATSAILVLCVLVCPLAAAQIMEGRLRVEVSDPEGNPVAARVELSGRNPEFRAAADADNAGTTKLHRLPLGIYQVKVQHPGFEDASLLVQIRSSVPQLVRVELKLQVVKTEVSVADAAPMLDPLQPALVMRAGRVQVEETLGTTLGRSTVDVVTTMPGWLLEANAVLHPRGSEYDTQYVIDGMPLYDNRSIAFAPAFENNEIEAVHLMTAAIPAEYGRRLGGVIALDSRRAGLRGHHSELDIQGGSYDTYLGSFSHQYAGDHTVVWLGVEGGHTIRYLDPPSLENFTNKASSAGVNASLAHDLGTRDRLTLLFRSKRTGFLVPNDPLQQKVGQRQDRRSAETLGQAHYQHTFSASTLGSVRTMFRDLTSELWSNQLSTPVSVQQDRGFREGALNSDITVQGERHTLKFGGDLRINNIREQFLLAEPDELPDLDLDFSERRRSTEVGLFVRDHLRIGNFAANVGVRFDYYRLLIEDNAISPRIALSYYFPRADLQLRASYDRIFQPPPTENLLLSSAATGLGLENFEGALAVPAGRAHFFEVGLRKPFGNLLRIDASHYWRTFRNYIDDDVLLNTGLSFPITFDTARIQGTEVRLELPRWRGLTSFLSYSNMLGRASSPVTGGLFIKGGEAEELRDLVVPFPISQDQRNTVAAQLRFEPHRRVWIVAATRYGSGLPVEFEQDDADEDKEEIDEQTIPAAVLDRINFPRGRVRPNFSLDFSTGIRLWERAPKSITLQFDVRNVTDQLNVVNFSGLFSGTALAPGRQMTARIRIRF